MTAGARAGASGDVRNANATTSTLNSALGTRHMRSWMTGAGNNAPSAPPSLTPNPASTVSRKRGRPRKYPLPDAAVQHQPSNQHQHEHATGTIPLGDSRSTAPVAERLPPSNSTSPQLANIVTDPRTRGHVDVTVFPSPTPSEEDSHFTGLQNHDIGTRQSVDIDRFNFPPVQSPTATSSDLAMAVTAPTRQVFSPPKRPAGGYPAPASNRARMNEVPLPANTPTAEPLPNVTTFPEVARRPSAPHTQHGSPSLDPGPDHSPCLDQIPVSHSASPQLMQMTQHTGGNPSIQDHLTYNTPAHAMHVSQQVSAQPFAPSTQQFATIAPSPRLVSNDWYSIDTCIACMRSFNVQYPASRRCRKDELRLQVLEEAVWGQDWAYLTLHQYYCIMTVSPQTLTLTMQRNSNVSTAYMLLREVLDDNSQLSPAVLAFFSTFPYTIDYLANTWPARYQYAESEFRAFVSHSPYVGELRQASERRGIPPSPREFASCAIQSMTFQRLLLRSIVRVLWASYPNLPEKGHYEVQILDAFSKAQRLFEQKRITGRLGGPEQADVELQGWRDDFLRITNLFKASVQGRRFPLIDTASPRLSQRQQPQQPRPRSQQYQQTPLRTHPLQRSNIVPDSAGIAMARSQRPPPPSTHPRTASQARPSSQPRRKSAALLPRPGVVQPQQRVPIPSRFGLHQAHLRSPVLLVADLTTPSYYFWQGFVHKPQRLEHANTAIEKLSFFLSAKELAMIANAMPTFPGNADTRLIDEKHKTIRLRCVKWPAESAPEDGPWAVADNSWVPHAYFTLNGVPLELRKKVHYGKDRPADLTGLVREGENVLEVSVMSNSDDTNHRNYLVAVEVLGIMTRATIKRWCKNNTLSSDVVLNNIRRKLMPSATDDDDIVLVESTLNITLRDPFSASKICDMPVRGTACLHNECFDLDTFLETRPKKGDVTVADQWRCPICKADARPTTLVVDGFLVEVREELERKGLLDTRAIIVSQDGSWKPKPEERDPNGVSDRETPDHTPTAAPAANLPRKSVVHDIIDLDSD